MDEYIKREEAIDAVKHAWSKGLEPSQYIETIPAADVDQARHGLWDDTGRYTFTDGSLAIRCTECGAALHLDEWEKYNWNYCPNCGAKMDGESDE